MEDIILENKEDLKSIKKDISKVGWSLVAFTLISSIVANGVYLLGRQYFPNIANTILFQIIVGTLPIYIIGLPIILLVTRKLPITKSEACEKLSVGKFICILFLCFGAMYISNTNLELMPKGNEIVIKSVNTDDPDKIEIQLKLDLLSENETLYKNFNKYKWMDYYE